MTPTSVQDRTQLAPLTEPPPEEVLLALDGGWVRSRDTPGGMEGKVAVIATGRERCGQHHWRLTSRRHVARFQTSDAFGAQVYPAAADQGVAQARQVVVLGDGAEWITSLTDLYLTQVERRLDFCHLLHRARDAVATEELDEAVAARLPTELEPHLRRQENGG